MSEYAPFRTLEIDARYPCVDDAATDVEFVNFVSEEAHCARCGGGLGDGGSGVVMLAIVVYVVVQVVLAVRYETDELI